MERQVGGSHYKDDKIQHAEFCQANKLPYIIGNTLKYVMRHAKKNGKQDLEKAKHYLEMMLELENRFGRGMDYVHDWKITPVQLIMANGIASAEADIINLCMAYHTGGDRVYITTAIQRIQHLIDTSYGP